jgi:hypothetical protein
LVVCKDSEDITVIVCKDEAERQRLDLPLCRDGLQTLLVVVSNVRNKALAARFLAANREIVSPEIKMLPARSVTVHSHRVHLRLMDISNMTIT